MALSEELRHTLARALERLRNDPEAMQYAHNRRAVEYDAVPTFVNWEEFVAVGLDGSILRFTEQGPDDRRPRLVNKDLRWVNTATIQGSRAYPELAELIPPRPAEAVDCPYCVAREMEPRAIEAHGVVCYCGGSGWVPADPESAERPDTRPN